MHRRFDEWDGALDGTTRHVVRIDVLLQVVEARV